MSDPAKAGFSAERLARIRPNLEKHIGPDKLAGALTLLARRAEVVHQECFGLLDREQNKPMAPDAIFRLYSMTKPIICVALMTLYEQGRFQLLDPVSKLIPAFAKLKVYAGDGKAEAELAEAVDHPASADPYLRAELSLLGVRSSRSDVSGCGGVHDEAARRVCGRPPGAAPRVSTRLGFSLQLLS